jgi:hypothetical protein
MKQKSLFLSLFTIFVFFGCATFAWAQASNNDILVGVVYNADGTCAITLPSGTTNGTTAVDVNGENMCVIDTPEQNTDEVITPIVEDLDEIFAEEFGEDVPPPGDRIIVPPPTSPTPHILFYINDGGVRATLLPGGSATVYWQAENIVENTCRGASSMPVPGWPSTVKQPFTPMVPEVAVTFNRVVGSFPIVGTYVLTLTGCRGWDGSFVPDQSVTVVVEEAITSPDTGTTDEDTTETTDTTPSINSGIRWNEQ